MTKIVDELLKTRDDLKHVTLDKETLGKRNFDLNLRLGELKRENATLSAMLAEKFEITPDAIRANSKLYQAGLRIRGMKATIKDLKEKLAHKLSDGEVIEIIRAYARKKEEVDVLKDILERIKSENETLRTNSLQIQKWLEEERAENDKLQQLYQDDHCELLDLRNFRAELKTEIEKFTCEPKDCGMNQPDWNGEVYGCDAGEDGKDLAGCPSAMANFIIKKIKESEEKYNEPTKN